MAEAHDHPPDHPHDHSHPHPYGDDATPEVSFIGGHPILNVANVAASLDYYCQALGFTQDWCWADPVRFGGGAPPTIAQVHRGRFTLMLAQQEQGGSGMWMYLDLETLPDLEKLYQEYQQAGARIVEPPGDRPWGRREMRVQDPDGHTFRIGAPLAYDRE